MCLRSACGTEFCARAQRGAAGGAAALRGRLGFGLLHFGAAGRAETRVRVQRRPALGTDGRLFGGRSARERFLLPSLFPAVFGPDARNLRLRILDELLMQVNLLADRQGAFIHRLAGTVFFVKQSAQLAHPLRDGRVFRIDPHVQASDFQRVVGSIAQGAGIIADFIEKRHERFSFPGKTRLRFALALLGGHEGCEGSGLGLHQTGENG